MPSSSRGGGKEALRASSGVLQYSFGFLALVLCSTAAAGDGSMSPAAHPALLHTAGLRASTPGEAWLTMWRTTCADLLGGSPSLAVDGSRAFLGLLLAYGAYKASQYR